MIRCDYFVGSKRLKNDRKPLFTVLWNLRVKSTQFLGNFNNKPVVYCLGLHKYNQFHTSRMHINFLIGLKSKNIEILGFGLTSSCQCKFPIREMMKFHEVLYLQFRCCWRGAWVSLLPRRSSFHSSSNGTEGLLYRFFLHFSSCSWWNWELSLESMNNTEYGIVYLNLSTHSEMPCPVWEGLRVPIVNCYSTCRALDRLHWGNLIISSSLKLLSPAFLA